MILIIFALIITSVYPQVSGPAQTTPSSLANNKNANNNNNDPGKVSYEEYTASDGTIKTRGFRYGFQYKEGVKPAKPSGDVQKETYVNSNGEVSSRSFRYGSQYDAGEAEEKPLKLKAPKLSAPTETPNQGTEFGGGSPSPAASSDTSSNVAPSASLKPSADDLKQKDKEIMNKMKDLLKERENLKKGI